MGIDVTFIKEFDREQILENIIKRYVYKIKSILVKKRK